MKGNWLLFYHLVIEAVYIVDRIEVFIMVFHPFPHLLNAVLFRVAVVGIFVSFSLFFRDFFFPVVDVFL